MRSRAAFKLLEINSGTKFIRRGQLIFDLGCAPGGWSQMAVELSNSSTESPNVFGIDLRHTNPMEGAQFMEGDIRKEEDLASFRLMTSMQKANVVLSDMSPDFTGDLDIDYYHMSQLNMLVLSFAEKGLLPGGTLLMKTLNGQDEPYYFVRFLVSNSVENVQTNV